MTSPRISHLCWLTLAVVFCSNCYIGQCTGQEVPLHLFSKPNLVAVKSRGLSTRYFSQQGKMWAEYLAVADRTYISSVRAKMPATLAVALNAKKLDPLDFRSPKLVLIRQDNAIWFIPEPVFAEHLANRLRAGSGDVLSTMTLADYERRLGPDPTAKTTAEANGRVSVHIRTANELSDWSVSAKELPTILRLKGKDKDKPWQISTNRQTNVLYVVMHQPAGLAERWFLVASSIDSPIFGADGKFLHNLYQGPVFVSPGDSVYIVDPVNVASLQPTSTGPSGQTDTSEKRNLCKLLHSKVR